MTAGIEIKNSSLVAQIDDVNRNLVFASKGSTTTVPVSGGSLSNKTIGITAKTPLVAIACSAAAACCFLMKTGTNSWDLLIITEGTTGRSVSYWIFDDADFVGSAATFGMQVFDAAGALVFCASQKPARLVQLVQGNDYTSPDQTAVTTTLSAGKTYATAVVQYCGRHRYVYDHMVGPGSHAYNYWEFWLGAKIVANVITYALIYLQNNTTALLLASGLDTDQHQKQFGFLAIDVSGL